MPVDVTWLQDNKVILIRFSGDVTVEDVGTANRQASPMIKVGTPLVHEIVDLSRLSSFPRNIQEMKQAIEFTEHDGQLGWTVVVATSKLLRFLSNMLVHLFHGRFAFVGTMKEALEFLAERDLQVYPAPALARLEEEQTG